MKSPWRVQAGRLELIEPAARTGAASGDRAAAMARLVERLERRLELAERVVESARLRRLCKATDLDLALDAYDEHVTRTSSGVRHGGLPDGRGLSDGNGHRRVS